MTSFADRYLRADASKHLHFRVVYRVGDRRPLNLCAQFQAIGSFGLTDEGGRKQPVFVRIAQSHQGAECSVRFPVLSRVRLQSSNHCLMIAGDLLKPTFLRVEFCRGFDDGKLIWPTYAVMSVVDGKLVDEIVERSPEVANGISDGKRDIQEESGGTRQLADICDAIAGITIDLESDVWMIRFERTEVRDFLVDELSVFVGPADLRPDPMEKQMRQV